MKGFTLVEVLVVTTITVMMAGMLVANFSRVRVDMNQTTSMVKDAIREAQSLALTGAVFGAGTGSISSRCGFGIHFSATGYTIYAGANATTTDCTTASRAYNPGVSGVVRYGAFSNSVLVIEPLPSDIFFEPPDPKTYFVGSAAKTMTVIIRRKGTTACPSADCRQINVNTSGQIQ